MLTARHIAQVLKLESSLKKGIPAGPIPKEFRISSAKKKEEEKPGPKKSVPAMRPAKKRKKKGGSK